MFRTEEEWAAVYLEREAYYDWDGNPSHGHPVLRSKQHSTCFFNSRKIIPDDELMREVASDLVKKAAESGVDINVIDCVVGPQTGATKLAEFIADVIGKLRGRPCRWTSPKKPAEDGGEMTWGDPYDGPLPGDVVLMVEDVLTTGGSVKSAERAATKVGAEPLPFFLAIVNRSNKKKVFGKRIVALVEPAVTNWDPGACEACKAGSRAIENPKDHWAELIA